MEKPSSLSEENQKPHFRVELLTPTKNETLFFKKKLIFIGRSKITDLQTDFETVSRKHLKIFLENENIYITDLNSSNGTKLNGKELQAMAKNLYVPGTPIELGTEKVFIKIYPFEDSSELINLNELLSSSKLSDKAQSYIEEAKNEVQTIWEDFASKLKFEKNLLEEAKTLWEKEKQLSVKELKQNQLENKNLEETQKQLKSDILFLKSQISDLEEDLNIKNKLKEKATNELEKLLDQVKKKKAS